MICLCRERRSVEVFSYGSEAALRSVSSSINPIPPGFFGLPLLGRGAHCTPCPKTLQKAAIELEIAQREKDNMYFVNAKLSFFKKVKIHQNDSISWCNL